jgi:serine/threonine protein kinase
MYLSPGTRLGPYTIVGELGAGGMGEVYRARDTRLDRDVALKIVPERLVSTPGARARLEREARAAARINHPHVCAIYDFGREQDASYLVLELVEGETLRDRLNAGPLGLDSLLSLGVDIADAVAAAHAKGVIHRDLKPGNIMVTSHGAKVMDFGVAMLGPAEVTLASRDATRSEGLLTGTGGTPGTTAYMSPEQARGEPVDERSDVFSLGAVLYEMATGRHPFPGTTTAVIFDGILNRDPVPPRSVRSELPPELERIVGKALEKDRDLRYQTATELRADLMRMRRDPESSTRAVPAAPARRPPRSGAIRWGLAAASAALLVAVLWIIAGTLGRKGTSSAPWSARRLPLSGSALDMDEWALSPDGAKAAYLPDSATVSVLSLVSNDTRVLDHLEPDEGSYVAIDWSADGSRLVVTRCDRAGDATLVAIDPVTGHRDVLARLGRLGPIQAHDLQCSLSPDGMLIAVRRDYVPDTGEFAELGVVDVRTGAERRLVRAAPRYLYPPVWAPNSSRIAYVLAQGGQGYSCIETCDLRGARATVLEDSTGGLAPFGYAHPTLVWLPDGRLVYSARPGRGNISGDAALWAISVNVASGRSSGPSELLFDMPGAQIHTPRVSSDGRRVAFATDRNFRTMQLIGTDGRPRFPELAARGQLTGLGYPVWTRDGLGLFVRSDENPRQSTIGRLRLSDGRFEPLTPVSGAEDRPFLVSPDGSTLFATIGSRLVAVPVSGGLTRVMTAPFVGTILQAKRSGQFLAIDHIGDELVVRDFDPGTGVGAVRFRYPVNGMERGTRPGADLSPDGARLALLRPDAPRYDILDAASGRELSHVDLPEQSFPQSVQWSADGATLYASGLDVLAPFWIARLSSRGVDRVLWRDNAVWPGQLAISPDGSTLAFTSITWSHELWMIERP